MNLKKVHCFEVGIEVVEEGCSPRLQTQTTVICASFSKAEETGRALFPELTKRFSIGDGEFRIGSIRCLPDAYVKC